MRIVKLLAFCMLACSLRSAETALPDFDFTRAETARAWGNPHHIGGLQATPEGLEISIDGADPYFHGPPRNYPVNQPLWMFIRIKSEQGGSAQVFFFDKGPTEENSRRFAVPRSVWEEVRIMLPALGSNFRLRIDPPGDGGKAVISRIRFEPRRVFAFPDWPWTKPAAGLSPSIASGDLEVLRGAMSPLAYELRVGGQRMGFGHAVLRIGYLHDNELAWLELNEKNTTATLADKTLTVRAQASDAEGVSWRYEQTLAPGQRGAIKVTTRVAVDRDRDVMFLPLLLLSPGEQSFGTNKNQGLFAGLEYLENEASSSEADLLGPESRRRVPASHKITMPLMAIQAAERYLGLVWDRHLEFSALFDSPDRTLGSGGHLMGVLWPGFPPGSRVEGELLPLFPQKLASGSPVELTAFILGGQADTIVPVVKRYVALRGLPPLPDTQLSLRDYAALAAQGWLQSKCREGDKYRHAVWGNSFGAQPAADAALYQRWLARYVADAAMASDLLVAASNTIAPVGPRNYFHSAISHIKTPAAPLVFGHVRESVEAARAAALGALRRFSPDGVILYQKSGDRPDYGKTYWLSHANGTTGRVVADLLEAAAYCGDRELIGKALERLKGMALYRNGVPRGAQTWEIPLHTPDILASAHMVSAYATGFELTGDPEFLREAIYWAWTGVPFVYLVNPTGKPVGPYGTIAVLGATSWRAPVWFGQPVQWCGLVYADALYRLSRLDPSGPWQKLADGITAAGLQHTWKADDPQRVGLLPDFFLLQAQRSDGPAINPGTLGINAMRLYRQPPLYDFRRAHVAGLDVHAPGEIILGRETERTLRVLVRGWPTTPYYILINGLSAPPKVSIAGQPVPLTAGHEFDPQTGRLVLRVSGDPEIQIAR